MSADPALARLRLALESGTEAAGFWRGIRGQTGAFVDLELIDCTEGFGRYLGRPLADVLGRRYTELVPTGIHDRLDLYLDSLRSGTPRDVHFDRNPIGGGPSAVVEVRVIPCDDEVIFAGVWDVSERETRLRSLERARSEAVSAVDMLQTALNSSPDGFAICEIERDQRGVIESVHLVFVNDAAAVPTGRPAGEWVGVELREWYPEVESSGAWAELVEAMSTMEPRRFTSNTESAHGWVGVFDNVITPFGPDRVLITWRPLGGLLASGSASVPSRPAPISIDGGTGLINRGEFRRRFSASVDLQGVSDDAVVVLDLDGFGHLNDVLGVHRSDLVLAEVATALRSIDPPLRLPARVGPDEFAYILPRGAQPDILDIHRAQVATVLKAVSSELRTPPLSASGGACPITPGATVDDALRDCDTALRASVREGGGRITAFTEDIRRLMLVEFLAAEDMHRAIAEGELRLAYQPIVAIDNGRAIGSEALIRWQHPEHGPLMPGDFIDRAEANGSIVEMGAWVIDRAIADLAARSDEALASINASGVQLLQSDVSRVVAEALERHRIVPARLVVEITESAILPDSDRIRGQLAELRQMGVQVAIDDFGSGFSSIAYLDRIPVDIVKMDRYFLDGEMHRRRRNLVGATAQMIRSIGARSLIEGIETAEQWEVAREAGLDLGQGYLFGRPV